MNSQSLRRCLRNPWVFLWCGWRKRTAILSLCDAFDALPQEQRKLQEEIAPLREKCQQLRDALYLANLEIADLNKRLETERADHAKTKGHVEKLWTFISRRHRLDVPAANGTIRKILQEAENQR